MISLSLYQGQTESVTFYSDALDLHSYEFRSSIGKQDTAIANMTFTKLPGNQIEMKLTGSESAKLSVGGYIGEIFTISNGEALHFEDLKVTIKNPITDIQI